MIVVKIIHVIHVHIVGKVKNVNYLRIKKIIRIVKFWIEKYFKKISIDRWNCTFHVQYYGCIHLSKCNYSFSHKISVRWKVHVFYMYINVLFPIWHKKKHDSVRSFFLFNVAPVCCLVVIKFITQSTLSYGICIYIYIYQYKAFEAHRPIVPRIEKIHLRRELFWKF